MNKINNIENEEIRKSSEDSKSDFDNEGHQKVLKEIDEEKADKLTQTLLENGKMPINDFIESEKQKGNDGDTNIIINLIKAGYKENEIMDSSLRERRKKIKIEIKNFYFRPQSYRFNEEKEFDEKFFDIIKKSLDNGGNIGSAIKDIPLKRAVTMEDFNRLKERYKHISDYIPSIDLSGEILPDLDWSQSREVFDYLSFDDKTFSQTSKEHLPEGYDPKEIFEKGKSIGLGIDDVHKMGYTGKGVSIAICDWKLQPHDDIKTKEYIEEQNASNMTDYFHASAVSSIISGKQTGIAPDSDLYFFAEKRDSNEKDGGNDLKSVFTEILKKNESLPNNKKIKVISISGPLYGKGIKDLVRKLEDSGVWVFSSNEFWKDFGYLEKKDPMGDSNNFDNYQHCLGRYRHFLRRPDALFVNSGNRTVADPRTSTAYKYDSHACASWAIPVVAGYYALACQADSTMTPRKFKKLARETAHKIDSTICDEKNNKRSTKIKKIKVIDIKALIQKIEEEKK